LEWKLGLEKLELSNAAYSIGHEQQLLAGNSQT
jgi:hypothetical protein